MILFDPNQHSAQCEKYLERYLATPVKILCASQLTKSTRTAPWRLDVVISGQEQAFVLQLDPRGLEFDYHEFAEYLFTHDTRALR